MTSSEDQHPSATPSKIIYYCKECKKLIQPARVGNKFQFRCNECKNKNVSFGTEKSIANFYDVAGGKPPEEKSEKEAKKFTTIDEYFEAINKKKEPLSPKK